MTFSNGVLLTKKSTDIRLIFIPEDCRVLGFYTLTLQSMLIALFPMSMEKNYPCILHFLTQHIFDRYYGGWNTAAYALQAS